MTALRAQLDESAVQSSRRNAPRRKLHLPRPGLLAFESADVLILDMSTTGLLLETTGHLAKGEIIELDLPEATGVCAVVKWSNGQLFGCEFKKPISTAAVSAALLQASPKPQGTWESYLEARAAADREDQIYNSSQGGKLTSAAIAGLTLLAWGLIIAAVLLA